MKKILLVLSALSINFTWAGAGKTKTYCGSAKYDSTFGRVNLTVSNPVNGYSSFEILAKEAAEQAKLNLEYIRRYPNSRFAVCVKSKDTPKAGNDSVFLSVSELEFTR